ncbi:LysR family transcriptional regulator [Microbacterium sp. KSW2-21]|uniref:LysR family transcriptional regulator n=1 Tax=Microbacterium algihabitans TaxID=3075992 RepID=A0ABU3RU83_9MICO|nr:LysR family transcriptional regulator [Microbacterium sp. KSW2-21]MDU0326437.1 LysR family transcriptional regulator [Microbacterium sp. KSW2-21]
MTDHATLSRLDLNLLVALDALLTERSVTRAAERLHLSQPALSASLSRLRTHFDDQILARRGNTYELTPFAVRLTEHTTTALEAARRVFESQASWSPAESTREFSIYGSDYGFVTIGTLVSQLAAERAPRVRFRYMLHNPGIVEDAATRLRSADGMVIPHGPVSDMPYLDLWQDDWLAVVADDNDEVGEELTMQNLADLPWVLTFQSRSAFTSAARQIQQLGVEPHIEVVLESFLSVGHFVSGTRRVGLVQSALAPHLLRIGGIRVVPLPFAATPLVSALWWHPSHTRDPEHEWMRGLFAEAGRRIAAGQAPA